MNHRELDDLVKELLYSSDLSQEEIHAIGLSLLVAAISPQVYVGRDWVCDDLNEFISGYIKNYSI